MLGGIDQPETVANKLDQSISSKTLTCSNIVMRFFNPGQNKRSNSEAMTLEAALLSYSMSYHKVLVLSCTQTDCLHIQYAILILKRTPFAFSITAADPFFIDDTTFELVPVVL